MCLCVCLVCACVCVCGVLGVALCAERALRGHQLCELITLDVALLNDCFNNLLVNINTKFIQHRGQSALLLHDALDWIAQTVA